MGTSLALLAHPSSGKGRCLQYAHTFSQKAVQTGFTVTIVSGKTPEQSIEAIKSIRNEIDILVVIGGDGSLHIALQAIADTDLPIYVVPMGTGNDFARTNNPLFTDIDMILHRLQNEAPKKIDLGLISDEHNATWFGQVLSTGFDSLVNRRANNMSWIKGQIKYTIATLLELPKFKPIQYTIKLDGQVIQTRAMLVSVANGPTYGGGMKIVPDADRSDGLLDVMILKEVSKFELLRVFPKVFSGGHKTHRAVSFYRTKNFSLEAAALAYADGEFVGSLPISGEIRTHSLLTWEQ
jgi:diacylglycerol kinase (ATP)